MDQTTRSCSWPRCASAEVWIPGQYPSVIVIMFQLPYNFCESALHPLSRDATVEKLFDIIPFAEGKPMFVVKRVPLPRRSKADHMVGGNMSTFRDTCRNWLSEICFYSP